MRLGKAEVMDKQQKYCIVTGANAGIGKEITAGLMQEPGSHVVMACRNMQQCEVAKAEFKARGLPGTCECSRCVSPCSFSCSTTLLYRDGLTAANGFDSCRLDLSDQQSIRDFAAEQGSRLKKQHQPLDVLVNNAGQPDPGAGSLW